MSIGMTFDQYWYGDVRMTKSFVEADRIRKEQINTELWLQGMYCYDAISCALQNAFRKKSDPPTQYPSKPYDIFHKPDDVKETEQDKSEAERLRARLYMHRLEWSTKDSGGSR